VVGAAMELRARLRTGERGEESGIERRETLLREVGMQNALDWSLALLDFRLAGRTRLLPAKALIDRF
jgi:hypothetical protein